MKFKKRILLVEADDAARAQLTALLQARYDVLTCLEAADAVQLASRQDIHLLIVSAAMLCADDHALLGAIRSVRPQTAVIATTGFAEVPQAVAAIRAGADDYLISPFNVETVLDMVSRLTSSIAPETTMVVEDPRSLKMLDLARRVAESNVTVMISGESGTGKEVFSRYIHNASSRAGKPFVAINCAAIPESMLESILFGHEKGTFTGAHCARAGKFEQANGGTLLLDEISEMDLGLQAKLLRVIQEKEVERLGGSKTIALDVRLLATTNRNLKAEVQAGRFREDLFYRLNVFPMHLPPLRARPGDIIPLAQKFIENYHSGSAMRLSDGARDTLLRHSWQGNVRELENVIQRALILCNSTVIDAASLVFEHFDADATGSTAACVVPAAEASSLLESDLKTREKEIIIGAVASNHSRKEAAEKLGISPRTLRYKLARFRKEGLALPA